MRKGIIHKIAHCRNCEWKDEDYMRSGRTAKAHALKFRHIVDVETGFWSVFGEVKKE